MCINYSCCFFTDLNFHHFFPSLPPSYISSLLHLPHPAGGINFLTCFASFILLGVLIFLILILPVPLIYIDLISFNLFYYPLSSFSPGPRSVQTRPLPGSNLRQLFRDERLRRGVHNLWPPTGQRHWCCVDLRLSQTPPECYVSYSYDRRSSLWQPGGHCDPWWWPQRQPDPWFHCECQPCLQSSLPCSCHPWWQPAQHCITGSCLQGHHWVRFSQDRGRGWERRSWA